MPRRGGPFICAVRRAAVLLTKLSTERGRVLTHLGILAFTCPYCSQTLDSSAGRDRHITLQPYCRMRRLCELHGYISAHMKKKQRRERLTKSPDANSLSWLKRPRSNTGGEDEDFGAVKRARVGEGGAAESEPVPPTNPPTPEPLASSCRIEGTCEGTEQPSSHLRSPRSSAIELFPIPAAGAPISSEKRGPMLSRDDLRDYLASCGRMGEKDKFEIAELAMTTKLNGPDRTRWLRSSLVSSTAPRLMKITYRCK